MQNWTPDQKVKEQVEAQLAELVRKHEAVVVDKDTAFGSLRGQLQKELIEASVTKALSDAKGSIPLLLSNISKNVRMEQKPDGSFYAEVINTDGIPRIDGKGEPMSISALVDEFKGDASYARAFDGEGITGSGATPSTPGQATQNGMFSDDMDPVARLTKAHELNAKR